MQLSIRDLTFAYPGGEPVFEHLNLNLDTGWRLGVIGRNGRGKTTLLRLMMGCMPFEGAIDLPLEAAYFPYEVPDASLPALDVLMLDVQPGSLGVKAGKLIGDRESEILRAKILREELSRLVSK